MSHPHPHRWLPNAVLLLAPAGLAVAAALGPAPDPQADAHGPLTPLEVTLDGPTGVVANTVYPYRGSVVVDALNAGVARVRVALMDGNQALAHAVTDIDGHFLVPLQFPLGSRFLTAVLNETILTTSPPLLVAASDSLAARNLTARFHSFEHLTQENQSFVEVGGRVLGSDGGFRGGFVAGSVRVRLDCQGNASCATDEVRVVDAVTDAGGFFQARAGPYGVPLGPGECAVAELSFDARFDTGDGHLRASRTWEIEVCD